MRAFIIVFLNGSSVTVKADTYVAESNGALVLESRPIVSGPWLQVLAVAPGQWVSIADSETEIRVEQGARK